MIDNLGCCILPCMTHHRIVKGCCIEAVVDIVVEVDIVAVVGIVVVVDIVVVELVLVVVPVSDLQMLGIRFCRQCKLLFFFDRYD